MVSLHALELIISRTQSDPTGINESEFAVKGSEVRKFQVCVGDSFFPQTLDKVCQILRIIVG